MAWYEEPKQHENLWRLRGETGLPREFGEWRRSISSTSLQNSREGGAGLLLRD
jgi:hypothetical protein